MEYIAVMPQFLLIYFPFSDMVPKTVVGKIIGSACCVVGIIGKQLAKIILPVQYIVLVRKKFPFKNYLFMYIVQ